MQLFHNSTTNPSPASFVSALLATMYDHGFDLSYVNLTPRKFIRFKSSCCKRQCCEYRIFDHLLGAQFRCFRRDIFIIWFYKSRSVITRSEWISFNKDRAAQVRERKAAALIAIDKDIALLQECTKADCNTENIHPYITRKQIKPYNAYELHDMLYIPITTTDSAKLLSVQSIDYTGFKRFSADSAVQSGMSIIGNLSADLLLVCEGWATGCTIHEATGMTTICAFNAGNLAHVVTAIREEYNTPIVICADNDSYGDNNIGLLKAIAACKSHTTTSMIFPDFQGLPTETKPTDFNDLRLLTSVEQVGKIILQQL